MRTDVDSAAAPEIVVEDPEARSKRLVGPAFWVAFVLTAAGLLVSVNQIFNLGLGGFRPVSTASYYLVIGLFGGVGFLAFPARQGQTGWRWSACLLVLPPVSVYVCVG